MVKRIILISSFCLGAFSSSAFGQERACIEIREKPAACERMLIKKTNPSVQVSSNATEPTVCICVSDFDSIVNNVEPDSIATQRAIDDVLTEWQLTEAQLLQLLRY